MRLEAEEEEGVLGDRGAPPEPGRDPVGAEEGAEVQVVPRQGQCPVLSAPAPAPTPAALSPAAPGALALASLGPGGPASPAPAWLLSML